MFSSDPFSGIEDLFNELTSSRMHSSGGYNKQSQSLLNTVETKAKTFLIFDLSGKELESVEIKREEDSHYLSEEGIIQKALSIKLKNNSTIKYNLPTSLSKRKMDYTFKNGILEVYFEK